MANPTTNKPANPEWDSAANPNLQWYCIFENANGAPRDLVGNVPAKTYDGYAGFLTGLAPGSATASFGSVTAQQTKKWGNGSACLCWPNRGYAAGTSTGTARTFAITFRHNVPSGRNAAGFNNGAYTMPFFGSGSDGNMVGLELNVTSDGVVTCRTRRAGSAGATDLLGGKVLDAGTWYSVFLTLSTTTGRKSNWYDHTAQAAGTMASFTDSASYGWNSGSNANGVCLLNPQSTGGYAGGQVEVYTALLANEDWDPAVSATRFSDYYADPAVWARGSYAPGAGTLTAGVATNYTDTAGGITVTATRPTSGASAGVYTYQWHRSQATSAFTPDGTTLIAGATSLTYTDTTVAPGAVWYYKCAQSDGSATVYTNSAAAYRPRGYLRSLLIGDSLTTAGSEAPFGRSNAARRARWRHAWLNKAHGARFAGVATSSLAGQSLKPGHWTLQPSATMTAGTFTLTWRGQTTSALAFNAATSAVQTALRALSTVGGTNCTVIGSASMNSANPFGILMSGAALSGGPVSGDILTVDSSGITGGPLTTWSEYRNMVLHGLADNNGVDEADIHLGTNDLGLLNSNQATFSADLSYLVNALLAEGFPRVRLHSPPHRWQGNSDTSADRLAQYEAAIDALCNGTTIRRGARLLPFTLGDNDQYDGLHWGTGGFNSIGAEQFGAILRDLDPSNPANPAGGNVLGGGMLS